MGNVRGREKGAWGKGEGRSCREEFLWNGSCSLFDLFLLYFCSVQTLGMACGSDGVNEEWVFEVQP